MVDRAVVPFKRWHMAWLLDDGEAVGGQSGLDLDTLMGLEQQNSWTAIVDGAPVACGGTMLQWPGRSTAWMYLNSKTGRHMLWLTQETAKRLQEVPGRIEITVRRDFDAGHRWARMLGFEVETEVLKAYGPEGEDHTGYVRVN